MAHPGERTEAVIKQIQLGTRDAEALARLMQKWKCGESAAIRRAIREMAPEVGAPGSERRGTSTEQLRRAAEKARDYYDTDLEAKEWAEFLGDEPTYEKG